MPLCACVATKRAREASFLEPVIGVFVDKLTWASFPYLPTAKVWRRFSQEAKQEFVDYVTLRHPSVKGNVLMVVLEVQAGELRVPVSCADPLLVVLVLCLCSLLSLLPALVRCAVR